MSEENKKFKVLYYGDDLGYFHLIQKEVKTKYESLEPEFDQMNQDDPTKIQSSIQGILAFNPDILIIDLAKNDKEKLHLIRIYNRLDLFKKAIVVSITDIRQEDFLIRESIVSSVPLIHVKNDDIYSVVYSFMYAYSADIVHEHEFVSAKLAHEKLEVNYQMKVSKFSSESLSFETSLLMNEDDRVKVSTYWHDNAFFESDVIKISSKKLKDRYYNSKFYYKAQLEYSPELKLDHLDEEEDVVQIDKKKTEKEDLDRRVKVKLDRWLRQNISMTKPKKIKVLVIDRNLTIFKSDVSTDRFDYTFRVQPHLDNLESVMRRVDPQIIVINLEKKQSIDDDEPSERDKLIAAVPPLNSERFNDLSEVNHLIKYINKKMDHNPFIICFNGPYRNDDLQMKMKYNQIMATKDEYDINLLLRFCQNLESKINSFVSLEKIIIPKEDVKSVGEIRQYIKLISISECDAVISSDYEIQPYTVLRVHHPCEFLLTVLPEAKNNLPDTYFAVISGITEKNKMELRQYINSIFFRALEEQKEQEKKDFEEKKQQAIADRQDGDESEDSENKEN
ncbi:hypothetical protein N9N67_07500 [Bacteriovoracaceae bacterium]|nr:hypothetical protein [Bacteriovoracaceae bacterium]